MNPFDIFWFFAVEALVSLMESYYLFIFLICLMQFIIFNLMIIGKTHLLGVKFQLSDCFFSRISLCTERYC